MELRYKKVCVLERGFKSGPESGGGPSFGENRKVRTIFLN
jgi:hypothetical protein